jgi:transcriptional regulator with XRE-family HTH domain
MRQAKISVLQTEEYFAERARRADPAKVARILKRVGKGNPPVEGDELPAELAAKKKRAKVSKKNLGSSIDDFMKKEGIFEEAKARAIAEVVAWQRAKAVKKKKTSKANFNSLRAKMAPAAQERSRVLAGKYRSGMPLDELRQARDLTQVHLAKILKINQAAVSKLERRTDMYVSTIQDFVRAMGEELKITARFPEGTVEITQFEDVEDDRNSRRVRTTSSRDIAR